MTAPAPSTGRPSDDDPSTVSRGAPTPDGGHTASPIVRAMAELDGVHERPLHEQPDLYQAVHTELQGALAAIDNA